MGKNYARTDMQKVNYTIINHIARERFALTWVEYGLADLVHNISNSPKSVDRWCYASKESLAETLGVTRQYVQKIIIKLIERGLIEKHSDTKHLRTTQLWFDTVIIKEIDDSKQSLHSVNKVDTDSKQSLHLDSKQSLHNNDIYNKDNNKDINNNHNLVSDDTENSLNKLLHMFKDVNPHYEKFFGNKTERRALQEMVDKYGYEKVHNMLMQLPVLVSKPYAPRITSPYTLQKKLGELLQFIKQEQNKKGGVYDARGII